MSIHIENYELYVIDYLEGNLDDMKTQEMKTFLVLHPHIAMDIEGLNEAQLEVDRDLELKTDFIESLKKNELKMAGFIHEENFENVFIADLEDDLDEQEKQDLGLFLNLNPELKSDYSSQQKTVLISDESIIFPDKESLKKEEKKLIYLWPRIASVAAILLFAVWLIRPSETIERFGPIARVESKTLNSLVVESQQYKLPIKDKVKYVFVDTKGDIQMVERAEKIEKLIISEPVLALEVDSWTSEMRLLQDFAFYKRDINPSFNIASLPNEEKKSGFKIISAFLWKTTKGQLKNMSEEIIHEDLRIWETGKIEQLTNGYISVTPIATE